MLASCRRTNGVTPSQSRSSRRVNSEGLLIGMVAWMLTLVLLCSVFVTVVKADPDVTNKRAQLVNVAYDRLKSLVRANDYVLALYTKGQLQENTDAESEVAKFQNELEDHLPALVVKTDSAGVAEEFGLHQSPSLLFFRKGNAIIYDGAFQEEALLEWTLQNEEPSVQMLNDENFEHLTQAASGSTTGDWFVMFGNASSSACRSFQPTWESVAARLKSRMNVALVDTDNCPQLQKRFIISKNPELIFIRLGKLYRYTLTKNDIPSLTGFALGWYQNAKAELVPQQDTPFDNIITWIVEKLKTFSLF